MNSVSTESTRVSNTRKSLQTTDVIQKYFKLHHTYYHTDSYAMITL